MAPTPSSKTGFSHYRTPQARQRLQYNSHRTPNSAAKETHVSEHPVEVIGRIRSYTSNKEKGLSNFIVNAGDKTVRVKSDFGYRDFTLDGISVSEEEDLDGFYTSFVEERITGVKMGAKCTIMMYGPTGSGKSYTMFGGSKQAGIVYRSLKDILGVGDGQGECAGVGSFVHVTVLEIYNEEIYDLLSSNGGGGFGLNWPKGTPSKVRLEVMGGKAKNATFISGNEAGKISREIQKVEKRRIVKSTLCNDRSSRSHCLIILDVPTVGGRLMLVDMAGSENIEQAGQIGFEAKMQTAKINQGNIALKRVVESIANGDSHVPFRDSKLTMLLQDSFEDDKSKILMILCASPDPKEIHKTISTLEYGAKAKCIVRGPYTPTKDKGTEGSSEVILGSKIAAMDQFIYKLQMENKLREKERNEAHRKLSKKEEEVAALRAKLEQIKGQGSGTSEEEINLKVNERTQVVKMELEKKLEECQKMANDFVEMERKQMEERMLLQQEEIEMLRRRLEELESELRHSAGRNGNENGLRNSLGSGFAKRLLGMYADEDMVKSMDLDMGDQESSVSDVKIGGIQGIMSQFQSGTSNQMVQQGVSQTQSGLSTVYEEEEAEEEEEKGNLGDEVVEKEVIEEKRVCPDRTGAQNDLEIHQTENSKDSEASRLLRIQNIFTLCGNYRELSQPIRTPLSAVKLPEDMDWNKSEEINSPARKSKDNQAKQMPDLEEPAKQKGTPTHLNKSEEMVLGSKENLQPVNPIQCSQKLPLSPLENKLPFTPGSLMPKSDSFSPKAALSDINTTPLITARR